jgi:uncharacterized protein (TIGR03086 family)
MVGDLLDHIRGVTMAWGGAAVKSRGNSSTMGPSGEASNLDSAWRSTLPRRLTELADAWSDPQAWTGLTRVGGNDLPAEVAGIALLGELVVHGWDLARATDQPFEPDPATLTTLYENVRQTFGPGHDEARGEAFAPAVPVAQHASPLDQTPGACWAGTRHGPRGDHVGRGRFGHGLRERGSQ